MNMYANGPFRIPFAQRHKGQGPNLHTPLLFACPSRGTSFSSFTATFQLSSRTRAPESETQASDELRLRLPSVSHDHHSCNIRPEVSRSTRTKFSAAVLTGSPSVSSSRRSGDTRNEMKTRVGEAVALACLFKKVILSYHLHA